MTTLTLSIFDPNTLLPHRAGIAGLALALSMLSGLSGDDAPLSWEINEDEVSLAWECSDREAVQWLLEQTYQVKDGYLNVQALNLDQQSKYIFTEGVTTTFLQHSKQRKLEKQPVSLAFKIDENQPEVQVSFRPLSECYYTGDFKEAFGSKGQFKTAIPIKGHHLPGLVEDFTHGAYQESPTGYLSLLFLPLACSYYRLPGFLSALVIPEVLNLKAWVKRRQAYAGKVTRNLSSYGQFRANGAGESALRFLLQEKLIDEAQDFRVDYCEVYRLGKQPWDGNQSYLKQAVYRVKAEEKVLELYQSAWQFFPAQVRKNDKGETWLATSKVLPWIADNLITGKVWYSGFYDFLKRNELYERKGLVKMTQYLEPLEQTFFDAVQGAFSAYLRGQILQAQKQGRPLDYGQVTDKVIYRLQRPNTQAEFAKAMVDFLSRHRSGAARGVGAELYHWLHRGNNWKPARDLALLAITTYTAKDKEGKPEVPETILDSSESEGFEMDVN